METIEKKVAEAIREKPTEITIGGKKKRVARPTTGTLIEVSKYISQMAIPKYKESKDSSVMRYCLAYAEKCGMIGQIAATLVVGAKNEYGRCSIERMIYRMIGKRYVDKVARRLINEISNEQLYELVQTTLTQQGLAFFLSVTTTLTEANLLKRTKAES